MTGKHVLLVVSGGIAAYKSLELVRLLRRSGVTVTCVLTAGGAHFVTALSLQALSETKVYTDLWSLTEESEIGHIQLARAADVIVVAPASADILARMAAGMADDLATTLMLATDTPVLVAPAMNMRMWSHPATVANMVTLQDRGVAIVGPEEGEMACHEFGAGRLTEPAAILAAIASILTPARPLNGRHAIVTSGPTHEPIDPVRFIANRSSGRQGHAIAAALAEAGAHVTLVRGPVAIPDPAGVRVVAVETAEQMLHACRAALPADIFVGVAAVGDWRVEPSPQKLKKQAAAVPELLLSVNPDILAEIAAVGPQRPRLVIGFAAETEALLHHAVEKRRRKGCDWLLANDVGTSSGVMGGGENEIALITPDDVEHWQRQSKPAVARALTARIATFFTGTG